MGPGDLEAMTARLLGAGQRDAKILVGPETGDDAGVYLHDGRAIVAVAPGGASTRGVYQPRSAARARALGRSAE